MPQDGHIQIHHRGARVDIRVGTMPTIYGESLVMRLLEKSARVLTPNELGLDPERVALLDRLVGKPHGLFLATGPTGSGKTTTLYSLLSQVNDETVNIMTLEDPVDVAYDPLGHLYVLDGRSAIYVFGPRNRLVAAFSSPGKEAGSLQKPKAFAVDAAGRAYVFDDGPQRIQVYQ